MYKILTLSLALCACALTYADQPVVFSETEDVNSEVEVLPQVRPAAEEARDIDFNIGFGNRPYGYRPYGYRPYGYRPSGYGYRPSGYGYRPSGYGYRPYGYRPYGGAYYG